jgi:hypothetical protein
MLQWQCDTHGHAYVQVRRLQGDALHADRILILIVWPAHRAYDVAALFFDHAYRLDTLVQLTPTAWSWLRYVYVAPGLKHTTN